LLTTKQHEEKTGLSVSSENTSQKMFIRNDKISEIINDLDSDGGNFSISKDYVLSKCKHHCVSQRKQNKCKVNSPFGGGGSSSSSSSRSRSRSEEQ
jgi:hypothetical protein